MYWHYKADLPFRGLEKLDDSGCHYNTIGGVCTAFIDSCISVVIE